MECGHVGFAIHLSDKQNGGTEMSACIMISGLTSSGKANLDKPQSNHTGQQFTELVIVPKIFY